LSSVKLIEAATTLLNDTSIVVNKENDVSRQVVKPIYVATLIYDDQTQRTEQILELGTTVQAGSKTVSALIEDKTQIYLPTTSKSLDISTTCYNKYLKHYNLPLLPTNQTIFSFLNYLKKLNFTIPLKLSFNSKLNETHIYIQQSNPLLSNHILINSKNLSLYLHLPLKSNSTKFSSPKENSFDNLFDITNNNLLNYTEINYLSLKISSVNVNGLTSSSKQLLLYNTISKLQFHIIGISETHLSTKEAKFSSLSRKLNNYTSFWSPSINRRAGVGIYIHNNISKNIARTRDFKGHAICIDLHFLNNKIRLIQLYFPTSEKKLLRKEVHNKILEWCQETEYKIIITGDFNNVPAPNIDRKPPKKSSHPESHLIRYLKTHQFIDTFRLFNPNYTKFSFSRSSSQSRIDQIWTNLSATQLDYADILENEITETDHHFITLEIQLITHKPKPKKQHTRNLFLWKNATKSNIENYTNQTNLSLQQISSQTKNIQNLTDINKTWTKINKALLKAAKNYIPFRKINIVKEFKNSNQTKLSPLEKQYKQLIYLKKHFNSSKSLELQIEYTNSYSNNLLLPLPTTKAHLNIEMKNLKIALENFQSQKTKEEILQKIEERNNSFLTNPKNFFKKTLERNNNISIDRILTNDSLHTDALEINQTLQTHFANYFALQPLSPILQDSEFYSLYQPHPELETLYTSLLLEINNLEWNEIIQNLPKQKAAGPSEISYEHIIYLGHKGKEVVKTFLSKCLILQQIPTIWKTSNLFLIPKKAKWDYTLDQVRPISIIEPVKKILTKIFTKRLDSIITTNNLLSNLNFAATANSSTHIPIQILNNTIEHYKNQNKEAWILFQDMSKAFDKINIKRLQDTCKRIGIPQLAINFITNLHSDRQARVITVNGLTNPITLHSGIEQGETYSPLL
jgi:exonuclease III